MDSLSAFMVLVISLLVVVCSLDSLTYMREYEGKGAAGVDGSSMNIFIASMVALLVMDNAFRFIVLFEMMSLFWFLVIARIKRSIQRWHALLFIAHAGSVLITIAFLLMVKPV